MRVVFEGAFEAEVIVTGSAANIGVEEEGGSARPSAAAAAERGVLTLLFAPDTQSVDTSDWRGDGVNLFVPLLLEDHNDGLPVDARGRPGWWLNIRPRALSPLVDRHACSAATQAVPVSDIFVAAISKETGKHAEDANPTL
mgnify:CR=1 FL=1